MAVRTKMDENLARKVVTKKQVGNPLNPFANPQTDQDDEEVITLAQSLM